MKRFEEDKQNQHPWDKKPFFKINLSKLLRVSVFVIGIALLLLSPVILFSSLAKGDDSLEAPAIKLSLILTLMGWIISEIGLTILKVSKVVQIIVRIAIFLFVVPCLFLQIFIYIFSNMGP